jgi:hypothetical protein
MIVIIPNRIFGFADPTEAQNVVYVNWLSMVQK